MMPTTETRVPIHTDEGVNEEIRRQTECNIAYYANNPDEIDARLAELAAEWDIERTLETNAASISLGALALGLFVDRKWFVVPAIVAGFLLQHALQGWCPPVPLLRRLGIRTAAEIDTERQALKLLRGDFSEIAGHPQEKQIGELLYAIEK